MKLMDIVSYISQPWHWFPSGLGIVIVMFLLLWFGGEFGVSSNLRTLCTIGGAGRRVAFFQFDWKQQRWNLVFIFSAIAGGYIAINHLASSDPVQISQATQNHLAALGIKTPQTLDQGNGFVPYEIFGTGEMFSFRSLLIQILGGFLVGFGARYAGGCTSGHAISGLSNLQLPSFIAVIGFFIGGLSMAWLILPYILSI